MELGKASNTVFPKIKKNPTILKYQNKKTSDYMTSTILCFLIMKMTNSVTCGPTLEPYASIRREHLQLAIALEESVS